jgi:hypothetical protein
MCITALVFSLFIVAVNNLVNVVYNLFILAAWLVMAVGYVARRGARRGSRWQRLAFSCWGLVHYYSVL